MRESLRALIDDRRGWRGCRPAAERSPQSERNAKWAAACCRVFPRDHSSRKPNNERGEQFARLCAFRGRRCGRDPLFWCGNLAIRRRPRPSRWDVLSPARVVFPWRFAASPAPLLYRPTQLIRPGPQLRPRAPQLRSGLKLGPAQFGLLADIAAPLPPAWPFNISSRCVPKLSAVAISS